MSQSSIAENIEARRGTDSGIQEKRPQVKKEGQKMEMAYTLDGKLRIRLAGTETLVNAVSLQTRGWAVPEGTKITSRERQVIPEVANDIKQGETEEAIERVDKQFSDTRAEAGGIRNLAEFFHEFGVQDIYIVESTSVGEKENDGMPGFDTLPLGNQINFNDVKLTFVIPETRKNDLDTIIKKGIPVNAGPEAQLNSNPQFNRPEMDPNIGRLEYFDLGKGPEKVLFLYGKVNGGKDTTVGLPKPANDNFAIPRAANDNNIEQKRENISLTESEQKVYDEIMKVYIDYKPRGDASGCKEAIIASFETKSMSHGLREILDLDQSIDRNYIPTDIEIARAKE
ncbi:MAG: hypothetical protein WCW16_03555 [Candidatus Magasanikbacteria bacterium]